MQSVIKAPCACCQAPEAFAEDALSLLLRWAGTVNFRPVCEWLSSACGGDPEVLRELDYVRRHSSVGPGDFARYLSLPGNRERMATIIVAALGVQA